MPNPEYSPGVKVPKGTKRPLKCIDQLIWGLWGRGIPSPLDVGVYTAGGWPAVSTPVLRSLAGKPKAAQKELALREGSDPNRLPGERTHGSRCRWLQGLVGLLQQPRVIESL